LWEVRYSIADRVTIKVGGGDSPGEEGRSRLRHDIMSMTGTSATNNEGESN